MSTGPRVVFMGTPEFAVPPLEALIRAGYVIAGVLTREDRPAGRGQQVEESPVKRVARAASLRTQQPHTLRTPEAQEALAALTPDLIVVAAFGLILPLAVLALPPRGCINVHGSLLPAHRGAAPIPAAILAGEAETGVSIMLMDPGVDTGPVLSQAALPIRSDDTTGSLTARLASLGADLLIDTLSGWLSGELSPRPQPAEGVSLAPRIEKQDGLIRWSEPATLIARRVRAYQPWPSAYTYWGGRLLRIVRARAEQGHVQQETRNWDRPAPANSAPRVGKVVAETRQHAGVITGDGLLWLDEVQLAGKKALPIEAFLHGAPGFVGSQL
jgi:methionyl-tRNA formyltransferase